MATVLLTGCSRGIGLEATRQYLADGWQVIATCRDPDGADDLQALAQSHDSLRIHALDVADPASVQALARELGDQPLDLLLHVAGIWGPKDQDLAAIDAEGFLKTVQTNSLGPLLMAQAFAGQMRDGATLALLTSRMGSIGDNDSGGKYAYRAAKAALNAVGKSLAVDLAAQGIKVVLLHPGWVATRMGGPNANIDAAESVAGLKQIIAELTPADSGRFLAFDGRELPW